MGQFKSFLREDAFEKFYNERERDIIYTTLNEMKRFLKEDETACIYGQNLFLDRDVIRFYAFSDDYLIIGHTGEYNLKIEVLKLKDISWFEFQKDIDTDNLILKIYFKNNKTIIFNNNLDTNREHSVRLRKSINEILEHLLALGV